MASVQAFIHTIEKINNLILSQPTLEKVYAQQLTAIRELLNLTNQEWQLSELLTNLKNMPLKSWSYFFNNAGKLLASHKLFIAHKEIFHNAMYELGRRCPPSSRSGFFRAWARTRHREAVEIWSCSLIFLSVTRAFLSFMASFPLFVSDSYFKKIKNTVN